MQSLFSSFYLIGASPVMGGLMAVASLATLAFTLWMIIDCARSHRDTYWIWIMIVFWGIGALVYFFVYYFDASPLFRAPLRRMHAKQSARELETSVHNIDNAYHRTKLGDTYRELKRWSDAAEQYRVAIRHDPTTFDARVHLAYVLMELGEMEDAGALLAETVEQQPDYEYGDLMWHTARCASKVDEPDAALHYYERLLKKYRYPKARVEYAELLHETGKSAAALDTLEKLVLECRGAPRYQVRRERKTIRRANRLIKEFSQSNDLDSNAGPDQAEAS